MLTRKTITIINHFQSMHINLHYKDKNKRGHLYVKARAKLFSYQFMNHVIIKALNKSYHYLHDIRINA
jgi:hypothetical protein